MPRDRIAQQELAHLGGVLRSFREQAGLSQEELADRAGLHRTYVGGVERGERNLSLLSLSALLGALNVTWTKLGRAIDRN